MSGVRFWLVRHGPTHAKAMIGWRDLPADLSDEGALERLSQALPRDGVIVSSDLARTRATAARLPGRRLRDRVGLREMHFGIWEGLDFATVSSADPELSRAFWSDPGTHAPQGGESWHRFQARVVGELEALAALGHSDITIVCHFGVILAVLAHATGMPARSAMAFRVAPLSLSRIDWLGSGAFVVHGINHQP